MASEQERAALAKKRGQAASYISDPKQRQSFVSAQGDAEAKAKDNNASDSDYRRLDREADDTIATQGQNKAVGVPSYKNGTPYVPKTGPAILHEGERVVPKEKNMKDLMDAVKGHMSGSDKPEKPKKELHEIRTRKAKSGGYIHEHHYTHPEHYKMEEHTSPDQDAMASHMMEHMGQPNPGEADADAGIDAGTSSPAGM
jgi:hypothetical protein